MYLKFDKVSGSQDHVIGFYSLFRLGVLKDLPTSAVVLAVMPELNQRNLFGAATFDTRSEKEWLKIGISSNSRKFWKQTTYHEYNSPTRLHQRLTKFQLQYSPTP